MDLPREVSPSIPFARDLTHTSRYPAHFTDVSSRLAIFHNLEAKLMSSVARYTSGDASAIDDLVMTLRLVPAEEVSLAPLIESLLKLPDGDVQVFSACALSRFGKSASAQVPALVELMNQRAIGPSGAAAMALGAIGTPEAVEALTKALQERPEPILGYIAGGLKIAGADAAPALPVLQRIARKGGIGQFERQSVQEAIAAIYAGIREENSRAMQDAEIFEHIPVGRFDEGESAHEFYSPYYSGPLNDEVGLVHDGRFRYRFDENGEIGLRIYMKDDSSCVVVMSSDGESFGTCPTKVSEYLATAILHMYGLDAQYTTWIERRAVSFGQTKELCQKVTYEWDEYSGTLSHPSWSWEHGRNVVQLLREDGIEW